MLELFAEAAQVLINTKGMGFGVRNGLNSSCKILTSKPLKAPRVMASNSSSPVGVAGQEDSVRFLS